MELAYGDTAGIQHLAGRDPVSRHELGILIARRDGLDASRLLTGLRTHSTLPGALDVRLDSRATQRKLRTTLRGAHQFLTTPACPPQLDTELAELASNASNAGRMGRTQRTEPRPGGENKGMPRAGTTCTDAINFLDDDLGAGSLNDVSIQIPHTMKAGAEAEAEMRAVRKRYDEWTWEAAEKLNRRFINREIAGHLRAGRYRAILTAPLDEARLMMYVESAELQDYFRSLANPVRAMQERYGRAGAVRYAVLDTNTTLHFTRFDKVTRNRRRR